MLAPHCRKTLSWRIRPMKPSYSALTVGPELSRLAERKLEPMSWHFIPASNSKAAGIPVFYLSPLLKGKTHCFWLSKHLNQQFPAAQPGAMAAARAKASAGGKEQGTEFSGSAEAGVRGGGWFTRTPGDTHVYLPAAKPIESSPCHVKARHSPSNEGIKAGQRQTLPVWGLQQVPGHLLCHCALPDDLHTADDDGVWLEADQLGRTEGTLASLLAAQKQHSLAWGGVNPIMQSARTKMPGLDLASESKRR